MVDVQNWPLERICCFESIDAATQLYLVMKKAMKTSVLLLFMFAFMLRKEVKLVIVYFKKIFHYQVT